MEMLCFWGDPPNSCYWGGAPPIVGYPNTNSGKTPIPIATMVAKIARDMWAGMKRAEGVVRHAAYYANVLKEACEKKSAL